MTARRDPQILNITKLRTVILNKLYYLYYNNLILLKKKTPSLILRIRRLCLSHLFIRTSLYEADFFKRILLICQGFFYLCNPIAIFNYYIF